MAALRYSGPLPSKNTVTGAWRMGRCRRLEMLLLNYYPIVKYSGVNNNSCDKQTRNGTKSAV